jgi:hypothetical protein
MKFCTKIREHSPKINLLVPHTQMLQFCVVALATHFGIFKTKYMIAVGNMTILGAGQTVTFGDKNFEVINEFVYFRV